MSDVLIRDVPDEVVAAIDARAWVLGLSRSELLRRSLGQMARQSAPSLTVEDLVEFGTLVADLGDPEVMSRARL